MSEEINAMHVMKMLDLRDKVAVIAKFTPMGRVADASKIKGTALYLASNASSFTTGLMLVTDGGCMAT